jgi:hypothetical protein
MPDGPEEPSARVSAVVFECRQKRPEAIFLSKGSHKFDLHTHNGGVIDLGR